MGRRCVLSRASSHRASSRGRGRASGYEAAHYGVAMDHATELTSVRAVLALTEASVLLPAAIAKMLAREPA
jgi:hypothetical protein